MKNEKIIGAWPTFFLCLFLLLFTVYTFFPGFWNIDSEFQLEQALRSTYIDWHPPLMGFVWSLLAHIYPGPPTMLVLQNILFWSALFLFALRLLPQCVGGRFLFIVLFAFYPAVYLQLGGIWKDCAMSLSLFLASALILYLSDTISSRWARTVSILLTIMMLFYAYAVRLNSLPAVIVICFWLGYVLFNAKIWRSIFFTLTLVLLFITVNYFIVYKLLHTSHTHPLQQVFIHDLAAISVAKNKVIYPKYITQAKPVTIEKIRMRYSPDSVGFCIFKDRLIQLTSNSKNIDTLTRLWWQSVKENPWIYLRHRARCFFALMIGCLAYLGEVCLTPYHITFHATVFYSLFCKLVDSPLMGAIFRGWIYVFDCLVALTIAIRYRKNLPNYHAIVFLTLSALLYIFGGYFYIPACEFRYVYWAVIAALLALSLLAKDILCTRGQILTTDNEIELPCKKK